MTALHLGLAIASEVIATLALKSSEGFSKPLPMAIVVVGYGISFFLLALVLKHFSVGTTYAIWSAAGTAAIALVVVGYAVSFWLLALVLKHLSVGTTYAIWSAVGTAAIALIGIAAYGEGASPLKLASLGLIVLGVIGLNAAGAH